MSIQSYLLSKLTWMQKVLISLHLSMTKPQRFATRLAYPVSSTNAENRVTVVHLTRVHYWSEKDSISAVVYQPARSIAAMVLAFRCDRQNASHPSLLECCEVTAGSSVCLISILAGALSEGRSGQVGIPFSAASTIVMATGRLCTLCL